MDRVIVLLKWLRAVLERLAWFPPLLARIVVGWVFCESGYGKLQHLDKVTGFFTDLGLPWPGFQAHLVAVTEFGGGILLLAGLGTRLAAIPLSFILCVAIATAKREELNGFSDLIGFSEFLYIVLLIWLIFTGPGRVGLDTLLLRKIKGGKT